jgi:hypothetical protein
VRLDVENEFVATQQLAGHVFVEHRRRRHADPASTAAAARTVGRAFITRATGGVADGPERGGHTHRAREKFAPIQTQTARIFVGLVKDEVPELPLVRRLLVEVLAVRAIAEPERRLVRNLGFGLLAQLKPGKFGLHRRLSSFASRTRR